MNILIIEDSSKVGYGGGQKITEYVISILSVLNELYLFDFTRKSIVYERTKGKIKRFVPFFTIGKIKGSKSSYNVGILELLTLPLVYLINILRMILLYKSIGSPGIVYCTTKKALLYGMSLRLFHKLRLIYHCHTVLPEQRGIAKIFNICAEKFCDEIIAVSRYVMQEFTGKGKIRLIYNPAGAKGRARKTKSLQKEISIGFVSNLLPLKGFHTFCRLAEELSRKDIRCHFNAYGYNPLHLKIPEYVTYKGFCKPEIIYNEIDMLVFCSLSPEACPLTPLEAQSFGIPVIAPRMGALLEIIVDNVSGRLYTTYEDMLQCVQELSDQKTYETFSARSLENARRFEMSVFKENILSVFGA